MPSINPGENLVWRCQPFTFPLLVGGGRKESGLVLLASTTCAEGICINYTVARDKIKARKCCCENSLSEMATSDEMATLDLCLACGKSAVKKDRWTDEFLEEAVILMSK